MTDSEVRVDWRTLEAFVAGLLRAVGMPGADALFCARCLVQTSLWGKDSHGVLRVPHYVQRIRGGAIKARPKPVVVRGSGALEVMDGDNGVGFLVARDAMLRAIDLAREHNVAAVGVLNSNHFGAAALYARLAADSGMVGIAMTKSAPKIIAPGGTKPITGSNPVAIGVPTHDDFPFLLDMSLSAVAGGTLLLAAERGETIPLGLATDDTGQPTDDPAKAFAGFWLPMAGIKGLGLSYAVDILSGLITGGAFGLGMKSQYSNPTEPSGTGHMMMVLNVEAIIGREELRERLAQFIAAVKSSPVRDESVEMMIPGERAYRAEQDRLTSGVALPARVFDALLALGAEFELPHACFPRKLEP